MIVFLAGFQSSAQVNAYSLTPLSGSFNQIVGGTATSLTLTADDGISTSFPIGFNFVYDGVTYTSLRANSNGLLTFNATGTSTGTNNLATTTAAARPSLAPLWDDLQCASGVTYQLSGTSPNQTLTVEWLNMEWNWSSSAQVISFQVILYESTNVIDFVYRSEVAAGNPAGSSGASIGLMGTLATDFLSLQNSSAAPTVSTTVSANTISVKPATGQIYRFSPPPATPPTPYQVAPTVSCALGTDLDVIGTPATNVSWYWQATAAGTSITNPYSGPYTVFANGTYYLRAYNTVTLSWSTASSSITITDVPVATAPPAPVAAINPSCAPSGSSLTMVAPPVGTEYYWQGTTLNGVSNANNATAPYTYTSSGTYYVAAYETSSQCWSGTTPVTVTVDNIIPPAAVVNPTYFNYCSGVASAPITAGTPTSAPGSCSVSATASGLDNSSVTATVNNFGCASSGTILTASLNATIGTFCPSWYTYNIIVNGITVATNQCSQTGFDLTPYLPLTSVSIVSNDMDVFGDNVTMNLTVNLTYTGPVYSLSWFDAASSGTQLGTGNSLETIGTSVLPVSSVGSYNFYVQNNLGGCSSAPRQVVAVNIADVDATLIPVNATCNGNNNGSFTLGTVQCGTQPFSYSVNGGAFSTTIPTNLIAGTYSVVIEDDNGLLSSPISVIVTQPAPPANLTLVDANYYTADVSWTTTGNETQWNVEYGPAGFTPGTGTVILANTTSTTLTNLLANTAYSFYVTAVCGTNAVAAGPSNFSTNAGFFTFDNTCGPGFTDISTTGTALNLIDDATIGIVLTSPITVQGLSSTNLTVSNNGWVSFAGITMNAWNNDWDDEEGNVYWQEMAIGGVNYLVVQWNDRPRFSGVIGQNVTFQILVNKVTGEVYYIYDDVIVGGTQASNDFGAQGIISLTGPVNITVSSNNATYLTNNSCVHFYNALCPNPINVTNSILQEEVTLNWDAGLYGETEWTLIYGPSGFDPTTSGTTITASTSDANIFGLEQLTDYDVYIYSECTVDNLTSGGLLVSFQTLPWCTNPSALGGTTAVDSLFSSWNFTPTVGAAQALSGFNLQYGTIGFDLYSGTVQAATGIDYADTVANPTFLAGGVYQVYVQAVCGTDTSNYSGPFTFVMPLSNDSVCGAEMLTVDGTIYTFNNAGGTVQAGESAIAPPTTGAQTTTGWINSTLNNTVWYTFVAPASGNIRVNNTAINYAGQSAVYSSIGCSDFNNFTLIAANDNAIGGTSVAANYTVCGLTPGETYYLLHDGNSATTGNYSISILPINLNAGTFVDVINVCAGDTVNLFDGISGNDNGGVWTAELASAGTGLIDSLFVSSGLAYQVFNFEYRMTDGCAYDSIIGQVQIYPPSSAGIDGTITVCRNEPYDLLAGLGGNVDLGGTWYNPSNVAMPSSSITSGNIPGQYNYDYITGNGVCSDDTANVLVIVQNCDWLDVQEMYFGEMSLLPNPTNGLVYITNTGSTEVFNYEITDIDGRVIATKKSAINGTSITEINLNGKVTGMYMIRVYNDNAEKIFRVILQ